MLIRHLRQALSSLLTSQFPHCEQMSHYGDTNEIFMRLARGCSLLGSREMLSLFAPMACHIAQESLGSGKELSLAPLNLKNLRLRDVTAQWVASDPCFWILGLENLLQPLPKVEALERH